MEEEEEKDLRRTTMSSGSQKGSAEEEDAEEKGLRGTERAGGSAGAGRSGVQKRRGWSSDLSFLARLTERYMLIKGWWRSSVSVGRSRGFLQRLEKRGNREPTSGG